MSDEPRSRRAARPASKAAGALAKLAELRRSGAKHGAVYDVKEEENVYDVVEESEYADIVAKRRDAGGTCVWQSTTSVIHEDFWRRVTSNNTESVVLFTRRYHSMLMMKWAHARELHRG